MIECAQTSHNNNESSGIIDLDLFESLLCCESIEELHTAVTKVVKLLGFEHFIYGVNVNVSLTRPLPILSQRLSQGVVEALRRLGLQKN